MLVFQPDIPVDYKKLVVFKGTAAIYQRNQPVNHFESQTVWGMLK